MNLLYWLKNKVAILGIALLLSSNVIAQDTLVYANYDWALQPTWSSSDTSKFKNELELYLLYKRGFEYAYDVNSNGDLVEYELKHCIIKVNSDDAIKHNNKLYIPTESGAVVVKQKARVIKSSGKVQVLNESNIKQSTDEETNKGYKYFAIDNIEKGDQIEYFYVIKKPTQHTGTCIYMQSEIPKVKSSIEVMTPYNLIFSFKSYNGYPEMVYDTILLNKNKNTWSASLDYIEGIKSEKMAAYYPNLKHVAFKLKDNRANGKKDVISYGGISQNLYQVIYNNTSKATQAAIKKLLKNIGLSSGDPLQVRIRKIEDYLKQYYFYVEGNQSGLYDLDVILTSHQASNQGLASLFANVLNSAGIEHELVFTCSRYDYTFDPKFEAYYFLQEYLLYFPEIDSYIEPSSMVSRLGYVGPKLTNNYGLFIKRIKLGDFESAVGKVKFIAPLTEKQTQDNLLIDASFDDLLGELNLTIERSQTGYDANAVQLIYSLLNEEQKKDLMKSLVSGIIPDAESDKTELLNVNQQDFPSQPLIFKTSFLTNEVVEKAGTKFVIKLGLLIGPQMEMYQEEKRKLPVMNEFNRTYLRTIRFKIPEDYDIKNLESLKLHIVDKKDNTQAAFISNYKIEGGVLIVTAEEYYKKIDYNIEDFEAFRAVINAAADFNKATIYLEKKN
jgi:hypothetical protein